ncbi:MAG: nucleoside-diphosphate kinase [Parcubacteria group bacterium]|nr:nucleoside-diphosphate kinase [Parcubacteria group bacterium]
MIKPHVFYLDPSNTLNAMADIIGRYLSTGLMLESIKTLTFTSETAAEFYREHLKERFFPELAEEMTFDQCVAMIFVGENAVQKVREINGVTNPAEALPGTLRHKYGIKKKGPRNAVHGSDSLESAEREIKVIFS